MDVTLKKLLSIAAVFLALSACSFGETSINNVPKVDSPQESKQLETAHLEPTSSPNSEPVYEFDRLQNMFISLCEKTSIEDIENEISENELFYTVGEYNKSGGGKSVTYVVAYTEGSAAQKYADSGDHLEITFDKSENDRIMYAQYVNSSSYTAFFYNYGTWFDFREKEPGRYSGYYVIDALAKEDGLTIEYSNGNKKTTNYFPHRSAEDVIKAVIDHSKAS